MARCPPVEVRWYFYTFTALGPAGHERATFQQTILRLQPLGVLADVPLEALRGELEEGLREACCGVRPG